MRSRTVPGQYLRKKIIWSSYKRDYLCGLRDESVCEFFVEGDKVPNVNIAVVLLQKDIFADLVSAKNVRCIGSSRSKKNYL